MWKKLCSEKLFSNGTGTIMCSNGFFVSGWDHFSRNYHYILRLNKILIDIVNKVFSHLRKQLSKAFKMIKLRGSPCIIIPGYQLYWNNILNDLSLILSLEIFLLQKFLQKYINKNILPFSYIYGVIIIFLYQLYWNNFLNDLSQWSLSNFISRDISVTKVLTKIYKIFLQKYIIITRIKIFFHFLIYMLSLLFFFSVILSSASNTIVKDSAKLRVTVFTKDCLIFISTNLKKSQKKIRFPDTMINLF